jgi:hypothetical protein
MQLSIEIIQERNLLDKSQVAQAKEPYPSHESARLIASWRNVQNRLGWNWTLAPSINAGRLRN